jgi:hypothetical protein
MCRIVVHLGLALLMAGSWAGAWAGSARVTFVKPEGFADIGPRNDDRRAEEVLSGIARHIEQLAARQLPADQVLEADVLDVNMAGYLEPRHYWEPSRVAIEGTPPSIRLRYRLTRGESVLASGEETVSDPAYLHFVNRYPTTDRLRFEKRMLDRWFADRFGAQEAPAR